MKREDYLRKLKRKEVEEGYPFYPHQFIRELAVMMFIVGFLILLAGNLPAPLYQQADPFKPPEVVYPEWYFLWLYGFLKFSPEIWIISSKTIGIVIPALILLIVFFLPFWDRKPEKSPRKRMIGVTLGLLAIIGMIVLSVLSILIK